MRWVHGSRRLGDLENARVTLRITNATAFVNSFTAGSGTENTFCLESTGGDRSTPTRGAQDNIFRYYEPRLNCISGTATGTLVKQVTHVNGASSGGGALRRNDIVSYSITFTNTSGSTMTNVALSDTPTSNLTLVAAGTSGCAYSSYSGTPAPAFSALGPPATWATIPTLAAGESVTVFMCGQVPAGTGEWDQVKNTAAVSYTVGVTSFNLTSTTLGTVGVALSSIRGRLLQDTDADGVLPPTEMPADSGISGVKMTLYRDVNTNGQFDAGDVFLGETFTAGDGSYAFNGIDTSATGTRYVVVAAASPGYTSTADKDTSFGNCGSGNTCDQIGVTLAASTVVSDRDFLRNRTGHWRVDASICSRCYAGEPCLPGSNWFCLLPLPTTKIRNGVRPRMSLASTSRQSARCVYGVARSMHVMGGSRSCSRSMFMSERPHPRRSCRGRNIVYSVPKRAR